MLRYFANPYLITSLRILCWSGNFVVARSACGWIGRGWRLQVSDMSQCSAPIVAWACVNYGTFKLGPNRASAFMYLHPVFGAILGAIFFSETLSAHHWVGIVLVLIGVVMVSKALSTKKQPTPSPAQG